MENERRQIVSQVADGTLSPEEAAARLDELEGGTATATAEAPSTPGAPVKTVGVNVTLGQVSVIGDTSVREVVADGPHTARQEGDRMIIEGDTLASNGFTFGNSRGSVRYGPFEPLVVRMNPDLALDIEVQAGKASVRGVRGPIRAGVQAGAIDVVGFEAPFDFSTEAGSVRATGKLSSGASRIRCGAGRVKLELEKGSSLRVTAHSDLGQVRLEGDGWRTEHLGAQNREAAVIGTGEGALDIDVTIGAVRLVAP